MLSVQLGSSRRAWLVLFAYVVVALMFGAIAATQRDAVAAMFCVAAVLGAVYTARLLRRRAKLAAQGVPVVRGRSSAQATAPTLFVSRAQQSLGARSRSGVVLLGPTTAVFIPAGAWVHLALRLVAAPFRPTFRFFDLAIDTQGQAQAALAQALHDAVARYGGFELTTEWTYASSQRWLVGPGDEGIVLIHNTPPPSLTSRWLRVPAPTPERLRWIRRRVGAVAVTVSTLLVVGGIAAWRLSGDADHLVAGVAYAVLVSGAVFLGLAVAQRRSAG